MIKEIINISIKEILDGRNYADAGKILFEKIQQILQDNNSISIDMKDVESVPTSFMNTSFGDLMNVFIPVKQNHYSGANSTTKKH